jgi:hypothetical protein
MAMTTVNIEPGKQSRMKISICPAVRFRNEIPHEPKLPSGPCEVYRGSVGGEKPDLGTLARLRRVMDCPACCGMNLV